jgi:hypothetical protein
MDSAGDQLSFKISRQILPESVTWKSKKKAEQNKICHEKMQVRTN